MFVQSRKADRKRSMNWHLWLKSVAQLFALIPTGNPRQQLVSQICRLSSKCQFLWLERYFVKQHTKLIICNKQGLEIFRILTPVFILKTIVAHRFSEISVFMNTRILFVAFAKYCLPSNYHHNALVYMWVTLSAGKRFHLFHPRIFWLCFLGESKVGRLWN